MRTGFFRLTTDFKKKESDMSDKELPHWVKVDKERFDMIINDIENAENNNLQARPNSGIPISFDESH